MFIQLLSVPILLKFWGTAVYGEWLVLSAIPSYLSMSDIGFGNAAANEMTMQVAAGRYASALRTFQSISALVAAICAIALVLAGCLIAAVPLPNLIHASSLPPSTIRRTLFLLSAYALVVLFSSTILAGFRCDGNYALGAVLQNSTRFLESLATIIAVANGAAFVRVALTLLTCRAICTTIMMLTLLGRSPWLTLGIRHADARELKRLLIPAVSFMAFPTGNALSLQGTIIVVGIVLGPIAATSFSTLRTLARFGYQLLEVVKNGTWPEFSVAYGRNDLALARKLHRRACQFSFWCGICGVATLYLTGHWLFMRWTNGRVAFSKPVLTLLLASVLISSLWNTSSVVAVACNAHMKVAFVYALATAACTGLTVFFTRHFGLNGTAATLLLSDFLMCAYVIHTSARLLSDRSVSLMKNLFFLAQSDFPTTVAEGA